MEEGPLSVAMVKGAAVFLPPEGFPQLPKSKKHTHIIAGKRMM
jgi:hypothetical protein